MSPPADVSGLLERSGRGDRAALDELTALVMDELKRLAHGYLRAERTNHTLQTTALVHEAYLRLLGQHAPWEGRAHFLGVAAQAMRRILVDYARRRSADRRGGGTVCLSLGDLEVLSPERSADLLALDEALDRLAAFDPQKHHIIELRYFAGLTIDETARVLGLSAVTVTRHWSLARAWLQREVRGGR
jgi:RNA polymerase sigma factor (TIGR02999 family)